jgi:hypothetical protein
VGRVGPHGGQPEPDRPAPNEGRRGDGERIGKALGLQLSAELANCLRLLVLVRGDLIGVKHDSEDVEDESEG